MGRVRRYKKFKAVDPFAKGHRTETDLVHDEPPDLHDERGMAAMHTDTFSGMRYTNSLLPMVLSLQARRRDGATRRWTRTR